MDCVYCGDYPTNHKVHYVNTAIDAFFASILPRPSSKTGGSSSEFLKIERSPIVRYIGMGLAALLVQTPILRFSDNIDDVMSERTRVIWNEANKRGIVMQQVYIFGRKREESRAMLPRKKGSSKRSWEYFQSIPIPYWLNQPDYTWVDDKAEFKKIFIKNNLSIAKGRAVWTLSQAKQAFKELGGAVIVKPREGSHARHTTVNITNEEEFELAYKRAKQLCPVLMIEQFIPGSLYRATCVNGKLIGILELAKPVIVADGIKNLEELRTEYNQTKRFSNLTDIKDDEWFRDSIRRQGYEIDGIPVKGAEIVLAEHSERSNGGYFVDITDTVPEETKKEIERAARVCEIEVIGFDMISKDLQDASLPYTFIEGNSLPYIEVHHIPYEGTPRDVAGAVWDMWGIERV